MKFFIDENLPLSTISIIQKLGFEVEHCKNSNLRGASDEKIAKYAKEHKMILITKDLEFGSLIFYPKNSHYGLLVLRLPNYFNTIKIMAALEEFLKNIEIEKLINAITILEIGRYRIRKLNK